MLAQAGAVVEKEGDERCRQGARKLGGPLDHNESVGC